MISAICIWVCNLCRFYTKLRSMNALVLSRLFRAKEVKTREEVVALFYTKMGLDKKSIKKSLKSKQ